MPDNSPDPLHPLEATLRAQAEQRRAELGAKMAEMPGPMRTQLQAEVTRQHGRDHPAGGERAGILAWFFDWQRGVATVAAALLVVGIFVWNGGGFSARPGPVAKSAPTGEVAAAAPAREIDKQTTPPSDSIAKRSDTPALDRDAKEQAKPAAVPAPPPIDALAAGKVADVAKLAQPAAPPTAAAAPVGEPRSEVFASTSTLAGAGIRQNFAQSQAQFKERALKSGAKDERAASALLNQFEFRQSGNRIEIVDADGSVYAGEIEVAKNEKDRLAGQEKAKPAGRPPAAVAKSAAPAAPTESKKAEVAATDFNFRAAGMNNTLRQKVTIEGVYQAPANEAQNVRQSAPGLAAGGATSQNTAETGRAQAQSQVQSRARVIGRAQVNGRDLEVQAEATENARSGK